MHEMKAQERRISLLLQSDSDTLKAQVRKLEAENKWLAAALDDSNSKSTQSSKELEKLRLVISELQGQVQASEARGLAIGKEAASRAEAVIKKAREEASAAELRYE